MNESIILGFRDLFNYKRLFIIFEIVLLFTWFMVISVTASLLSELNSRYNEANSVPSYSVVPINNNMSNNDTIVNKLNKLLHKGGNTFFYSAKLAEEMGVPTLVLLDNQFNQNNESTYAKLYANPTVQQKIKQSNKQFPEPVTVGANNPARFDERIYYDFPEDQLAIVLLKTNHLSKWINTTDGTELMSFVENLRFSEAEKQKGLLKELTAALHNSFIFLQLPPSQNTEVKFILQFIYPVVALLIAALLVAFTIMYNRLFKQLFREYTIHLISGATLKHIFLRNSVFIFSLVFLCFIFILILNGFQINLLFWIAFTTLALVFIVFELLLFIILKRENLSLNLKGDF